jgi:hypothetical protein
MRASEVNNGSGCKTRERLINSLQRTAVLNQERYLALSPPLNSKLVRAYAVRQHIGIDAELLTLTCFNVLPIIDVYSQRRKSMDIVCVMP